MRLLVLFVLILGCGHNKLAHKPIPWDKINPEDRATLPLLIVDEEVTSHPKESRGFVEVPLDYQNPDKEKLNIFYRFIACTSCKSIKDTSKPIFVMINDGPGRSSEILRTYTHTSEKEDVLTYFLKDYRILLFDQRGTGQSSPLDLENSNLKPEVIAQFFDSDEVAKDTAQVVKEVLKGQSFYLIGIGYGGLVLYNYMFEQRAPRPKSYIFANSTIPPYNFIKQYNSQRRLQVSLNYQMQRSYPQFKENIRKLQNRLRNIEISPKATHSLYKYMGDVNVKDWKFETHNAIKDLLKMNDTELEEHFSFLKKGPNLLEYLLTARSVTPAMTYRTIHQHFNRRVPMRPWMLNGFWQNAYLGETEESWESDWILRVDKYPPPGTVYPSLRQLSLRFQYTPALFIFGRGNKKSEVQFRRRELKWFKSPKVQVVEVPGSGDFIFSKGGVQLVKRILNRH